MWCIVVNGWEKKKIEEPTNEIYKMLKEYAIAKGISVEKAIFIQF